MIKKYRNALLAAAVASVAVGCGGGSNEDPLAGDPAGNLLGSDPAKKQATAQAIAQLLGDSLLGLIGTTSTVFDTFNVITSPNTNVGKVLAGSAGDAAPSGDVTTVSAPCSKGGNFKMDIQLDILKDGADVAVVPDIANGFEDFPNGDVTIALGMDFTMCNEPKHTYNDDPTDDLFDPNEDQLLDGKLIIRMNSENDIPGSENVTTDFELSGSITMENYFIKKNDNPTDILTGDVTLSLVTDNVNDGSYSTVLDFGITSSDPENGGSTRTTVRANGSMSLSDSFNVEAYSLSLGGGMLNVGGDAPGEYSLFTEEAVGSTGGTNPSSGRIGVYDKSTDLTHFATVTSTGLSFEIYEEGNATPILTDCTWEEINKVDGQSCEI